MSYLEGETFEYKKDANGIWQHKNCKGIDGKEVELFKVLGNTYLICRRNNCASSAEQVMKGKTKRSTLDD